MGKEQESDIFLGLAGEMLDACWDALGSNGISGRAAQAVTRAVTSCCNDFISLANLRLRYEKLTGKKLRIGRVPKIAKLLKFLKANDSDAILTESKRIRGEMKLNLRRAKDQITRLRT